MPASPLASISMINEKLFIHLPPKIAKQLELASDKDEWNYYEILNLAPDSNNYDIERALNRALDLLSRLKYNPHFKDDASRVSQMLETIAKVLREPLARSEYDAQLNQHTARLLEKKNKAFRQLIQATAQYEKISTSEKDILLQYASKRDVPKEEAQSILDSIPITEDTARSMIAFPPILTATLPRYLEEEAFQLSLKKLLPQFNSINEFQCGNCGSKRPAAHIACECGSLLRGKVFCLQCKTLYSPMMEKCPDCGNESNLMVSLLPEDVSLVRKRIEILMSQDKCIAASTACKDLLFVKPAEEFAKKYIQQIEKRMKSANNNKNVPETNPKPIHKIFYVVGAVMSVLTFVWLMYKLFVNTSAFIIVGYFCLALAIVSGIIGWMLHILAAKRQIKNERSKSKHSKTSE